MQSLCPSEKPVNFGGGFAGQVTCDHSQTMSICLSGPPGCGKTELLEATARELGADVHSAAILANSSEPADARRLAAAGIDVVAMVRRTPELDRIAETTLRSQNRPELLFIECGSAAPAALGFAHCLNVGVFSVTGGNDKPAKFPEVIAHADAVVLAKVDLLAHVPFEIERFRAEVRRLNPAIPLFELSSQRPQSMQRWLNWLLGKRLEIRGRTAPRRDEQIPGLYCG